MAPRLGDILIQQSACTPGAVHDALRNQVIFGGRLGTNLLEIRAVTEEALARALARQHALPSMFGEMCVDRRATALLSPDIADRFDAVPYLVADRRLALLVVDPKNLAMLDEVAFATGKQVHPIVVPEARLWALLRQSYGIERHRRGVDVEFGGATRGRGEAPAARPPAVADLMDEGAFESLYGTVGMTPAARPGAMPPAPGAAPLRSAAGPAPDPAAPGGAAAPPPFAVPTARDAPPRPVAGPPAPDDVIDLTELILTPAPLPSSAPRGVEPAVVAALAANPGHAPPRRLVRPAAAGLEPEPPPLGFEEALRFLGCVAERDAIARTVLRYARSKFRRAVLLTILPGVAEGWSGLGENLGADRVRRIQLALGTPGIVETVVRTRAHFLGPIPRTEANIRLLKALGGGVPGNALLVPILALGRVVNVFYGDNAKGGLVDPAGVGELLILATRIAKSYDTLIARVR